MIKINRNGSADSRLDWEVRRKSTAFEDQELTPEENKVRFLSDNSDSK